VHAQEKQETAVQKDRSAVAGSGSHESRCPQQSQFPSLQAKKGVKQLGSRIGNWLTSDQARLILQNADGVDLRSLRDLSMMAVLLGCGLRRAELSALEVEDLQIRQGHWAIVDLVGKGGHGEKAFPRTSFGTWFGDVPNGRAWTTSLHTICAAMPNAGLCRITCVLVGKRGFCDRGCGIIWAGSRTLEDEINHRSKAAGASSSWTACAIL